MTIDVNDLMRNSFVITDDDHHYRNFCGNLASAGFVQLPAQFMAAVKGEHLENRATSGSYGRSPGVTMSKAYNHTAVVRLAKTLGLDYVGIFEQDAYPALDCARKLNDFLATGLLPNDIGLLSLGSIRFVTRSDDSSLAGLLTGDRSGVMGINRDIWGSHALIVFSSSYDEYISNAESSKFSNPPDAYERLVVKRYCTPVSFFIQVNDGMVSWLDWCVDKDNIDTVFGIGINK